MTAKSVIDLIPIELFEFLSAETQVDYQVKKLTGETIFKLILFSMIDTNKVSLRVMESFLESVQFRQLTQKEVPIISKFNSIRDRICSINPLYFEQLQQAIFTLYNKELQEENALSKTDSTYVSIAAKLISIGMRNGTNDAKETKKQIKYSVNLKGSLPSSVKVFTEQSYISEDLALSEVINNTDVLTGNVVVFDRGLQKRSFLEDFTRENKFFVTRAMLKIKHKTVEERTINKHPVENCSVKIIGDSKAYLYVDKSKQTEYLYRVIRAIVKDSGEEIVFVSNLLEEDAYFIAQLYKQRWEIEVFFKYLKQHLNVSHLVSRNENGIKVMIYMTMILATLIIVYKKKNNLKGFKIAKLKFGIELENEIIKSIVLLCGGNPQKAMHLFGYD